MLSTSENSVSTPLPDPSGPCVHRNIRLEP